MRWLLLAATVWAGRPMFHDLTLEELIGRSDIVARVTRVKTHTRDEAGCPVEVWTLRATSMLKTPPNVRLGSTLEVIVSPTGLFDCLLRKKNPSGATFSAERYEPSKREAYRKGEFFVFVVMGEAAMTLTAERGYESLSRRAEIMKLLAKPQ